LETVSDVLIHFLPPKISVVMNHNHTNLDIIE